MTSGLIIEREGGGATVRIRISYRADLGRSRLLQDARRALDMERARLLAERRRREFTASFTPTVLAVIATSNRTVAKNLRGALQRAFGKTGAIHEDTVREIVRRCRLLGFTANGLDVITEERQVFRSPIVTGTEYLDDPSVSRAELLDRLEKNPNNFRAGKAKVDVALSDQIGGLARVRKTTSAQREGAKAYRTCAERALLGAGQAFDYRRPMVDTSVRAGAVAEAGADARLQFEDANAALGDLAPLAERIIVRGETVSDAARAIYGTAGGAARDKVTGMLLAAANDLAKHFGFAARRHSAKVTAWSDGSKARIIREDEAA